MVRFVFGGGVSDLLKEGTKHFQGLDEAVLRNIDACKQLSQITRTSLGPHGMNKIVVNHLEKIFVTNDSATIVKEMDVIHPAAKMIVYASQMQEQEIGDGTNSVIVLAGELLVQAESLLKMGLHTSEVVDGYVKAAKHAQEVLQSIVVRTVDNVKDREQVAAALKTVVAAKQYGYEDLLAPLIADACISVCPKTAKNFNVDNVRVAKIPGASVSHSSVVNGFVLVRQAEGTIKHVKHAKVAVFSCGIDIAQTETKGNILIKSADQLQNYSKSEEAKLEEVINQIAGTGVNVVISGANIGELALHFLERSNIMAIKVPSKFDLRRAARAVNAIPLVRLGAPTQEEVGSCDYVSAEEIGSTKVVIFKQQEEQSGIATIVVRGSTQNILDDIERSIDDSVNVYKAMARDGRFVAGAGAAEIEVARQVQSYGDSCSGLEQYSINKYGEALEVVPKSLAENAGMTATELITSLYAAHQNGATTVGVDCDNQTTMDAVERGVLDLYVTKQWMLKLATDAAVTVLRVDQIIMAKQAGGPKPRESSGEEGPED